MLAPVSIEKAPLTSSTAAAAAHSLLHPPTSPLPCPQRNWRALLRVGLLPASPAQPALVWAVGGGDRRDRRHRQGVCLPAGAPGCARCLGCHPVQRLAALGSCRLVGMFLFVFHLSKGEQHTSDEYCSAVPARPNRHTQPTSLSQADPAFLSLGCSRPQPGAHLAHRVQAAAGSR